MTVLSHFTEHNNENCYISPKKEREMNFEQNRKAMLEELNKRKRDTQSHSWCNAGKGECSTACWATIPPRCKSRKLATCFATPVSGQDQRQSSFSGFPSGLSRSERQLTGYQAFPSKICSPLRACPGGSDDFFRSHSLPAESHRGRIFQNCLRNN